MDGTLILINMACRQDYLYIYNISSKNNIYESYQKFVDLNFFDCNLEFSEACC